MDTFKSFVFVIGILGIHSETTDIIVTIEKSTTFECTKDKTINCSVSNTENEILADRFTTYDQRFKIQDESSCIIEFSNISLDDTGSYNCAFDSGFKQFHLQVQRTPSAAQLTCNSKRLQENNTQLQVSHDDATFICYSNGAYPNTTFVWYVDGEQQTGAKFYADESEEGAWNCRSVFKVAFGPVTTSDETKLLKKVVKCVAQHPQYVNGAMIIQGTFIRGYETVVEIIDTSGKNNSVLQPGEKRDIQCEARGLPSPTIFRIVKMRNDVTSWDDIWIIVANQSMYTVTEPGVYGCKAKNVYEAEFATSADLLQFDSSSPTDSPGGDGDQSHAGAIVGGVIGVALAIALIGALVFYLFRTERACFKKDDGARQRIVYKP